MIEEIKLTLRDKYNLLTPGQKRTLIKNFYESFGICIKSFYNKVNNEAGLCRIERQMFSVCDTVGVQTKLKLQ